MGKHGRVAELGGPSRSHSDVGENARTGPVQEKPVLARRRENRKSTMRSGRTIGEARERLETKSERAAARKKDKRKNATRIIVVSLSFVGLVVVLVVLAVNFFSRQGRETEQPAEVAEQSYIPTIEIVDEDASATSGKITGRMRTYIGTVESDLKALGLTPVKAVLPTGAIREVDFYLDGHPGFIKTTIDRDAAVTAEDTERMLRYLTDQGITEFQYIDVRIPGRAYWK